MTGIALEPDFTTEAADIQKELENYTHKRRLIEPVKPAYKSVKRATRQDTKSLHEIVNRGDEAVTTCHQLPISTPISTFISLEKRLTKAIFDILHYLGRYI